MENPVEEINGVVYRLTQGSPRLQQQTIEHFFTPNASFSHPLCSVSGSRKNIIAIFHWYKIMSPKIEIRVNGASYEAARQKLYVDISQTFRIWPLIPLGHRADVNLIVVLQLTRDPAGLDPAAELPFAEPIPASSPSAVTDAASSAFTKSGVTQPTVSGALIDTGGSTTRVPSPEPGPQKYYIKSQTDLYQTIEIVKFISLLGILPIILNIFRSLATYACLLGSFLGSRFTATMQNYIDKQVEHRARTRVDPAFGPSYAGDMTDAQLEREKQMDIWEAEARVFGQRHGQTAEEWEAGKMKLKMSMKMENEAEKRRRSVAGLVASC